MSNLVREANFFDSWFNSFFNSPKFFDFGKSSSLMKTDVVENDNEYKLYIDLPGFSKEQISLELENGYINICAQSKKESQDNGKYLCRERVFESLKRSYYVGDNISESDVKAKLSDGVLELTVPKKLPEIPAKKQIEIE